MITRNLRRLGETEIWISPVALGCWPIAGMTSLQVNDADSLATIDAALDSGINLLDTAYCYGANGESESLIGQAIRGRRDQVVIASKGGIHWNAEVKQQNDARPETIRRQCDESLQRMAIDVIDLHYLHSPDPLVPIAESAGAFARLIETGKIRAAGASNLNVSQLSEFQSICSLSAVQPKYNLLQRDIEVDLIPWCQARHISVIHYWPLMKGLLAGKIRRGHVFDPHDSRLKYEVFQGEKFELAQRLLDELDKIAADVNKSVSQVVINWSINRPGITATLCGAKRDWQIRETSDAMSWELDASSLQKIEDCIASLA